MKLLRKEGNETKSETTKKIKPIVANGVCYCNRDIKTGKRHLPGEKKKLIQDETARGICHIKEKKLIRDETARGICHGEKRVYRENIHKKKTGIS